MGSPKLSSLVKEDFRTSRELSNSKFAAKIRHLILDRFPLLVHNQPPSRIKLSFDWLNNKTNFIVKVFEKIIVTKSFHREDVHESLSYDTSAIAKREGSGPIELSLIGDEQLNMHE